MLDEGLLGTSVMVRAQLSCWYPEIPGAWRQDPAKGGGGSLIDMGTHCIDLLTYKNLLSDSGLSHTLAAPISEYPGTLEHVS